MSSRSTIQKLLTCEYCDQTMSNKENHLQSHKNDSNDVRIKDGGKMKKNKICRICNKRFFTKRMMENHCYIIHKKSPIEKILKRHNIVRYLYKVRLQNHSEIWLTEKYLKITENGMKEFSKFIKNEPNVVSTSKISQKKFLEKKFQPNQVKNDTINEKIISQKTLPSEIIREVWNCHICKKQITSKSNLKKHLERHNDVDPWSKICEFCSSTTKDKYNMNLHVKTKHGIVLKKREKINCMSCDMNFFTPNGLQRHAYSHKENQSYSIHAIHSEQSYKLGKVRQHQLIKGEFQINTEFPLWDTVLITLEQKKCQTMCLKKCKTIVEQLVNNLMHLQFLKSIIECNQLQNQIKNCEDIISKECELVNDCQIDGDYDENCKDKKFNGNQRALQDMEKISK